MEYTTDKSFAGSSDELSDSVEVLEFREPTDEELELDRIEFEKNRLIIKTSEHDL